MKKILAISVAVIVLLATIPFATSAAVIWTTDAENSFSKDITDIASTAKITADNIESVLGDGWSIYNPNDAVISDTFIITKATSASYNKDHYLEINRKGDSGKYHVIGIKKDFDKVLNGKAKLSFETVSDVNTNIYVYNNAGDIIMRLRYHGNAIKLTTAKSAETAICSVAFANSVLNWELDFDLAAGTMGLSIVTSQNYATAPSGAVANLDVTSATRTIKTTTPFDVTDGATDIKSFIFGTNTYGYRARLLSYGVEVQKQVDIDTYESDAFEGSTPEGWSTYLANNATGTVSISSDKTIVSGNALKVDNTSSSNVAIAAEKTFAKPYTDDVVIETSFRGNAYSSIELLGANNSSIFRFYFDASKAQLRWQNSSDQLVPLSEHEYSYNRLYKVAFTVYPVEGTMDMTFSYTISDNEKEKFVNTHEAFTYAIEGNTVVVSSKRPIKIGGPSGKNLSIEKVQLGIRRKGTTYFDDFAVKVVNKDAIDARTGVLKDATGKCLNELAATEAETSYTYTMSVKNTEAMKNVNLIIAQYAADGSFKQATLAKKEIAQNASGSAAEISVPFVIKTSLGEKVRIFAMDSNLVPIFEGYDYLID